jgi:phage protein D
MPIDASQQNAFSTDVDVIINGEELDDGAVIGFVVDKDLNQPDAAAITLRNDNHDFTNKWKHGQSVEIKAGPGSGGEKKVLYKGEINSMEPSYRAGGDSRMVIRAYNKLHRLLRGKKSKTYQQQSDQDVCSSIAGQHGMQAQCGSSPKITHEHIYQHNQSDLEFLRVRAARLGFAVWADDTKLYFDKPKLDVDSGIEIKLANPGEHHLKAFSAKASAVNVVKKVTVRGWDPKKKEEIVGEVSAQSSPLGSANAASSLSEFGEVVTYTVDHPIYSVEEAKAIAESRLGELSMSYIVAEAECRGHGDYKLGIVVKIVVNGDQQDDRFNGKYLVHGVSHRYSPAGAGGAGTGGFTSVLRLSRDAEK